MSLTALLLIVVCVLLIGVLIKWSAKRQNREIIDEWFREDVDMETYWDKDEQEWVDNTELERRKKQISAQEKQFDATFAQNTLRQLYDLHPEFENLDTQGFEELNKTVTQLAAETRYKARKIKANYLKKK
ncbi:MAG: hypothetical protein IPN94_21235 [Sphingobacteriales bacterium]|nr:hypothetical protein [Sphingobacteriales bacterium]